MTPDNFSPSIAAIIHEQLGIKNTNVITFDMNVACSGFVFGLATIDSYLKSGLIKNALLIGSETFSKILDMDDRSTAIIFGDGAGGCYLEQSDNQHVLNINLNTKGESKKIISPVNGNFQMEGQEVFKFGVEAVKELINKTCSDCNIAVDDINYFICHQANTRIFRKVARDLNLDEKKFLSNLEFYGNTSSASIPILLSDNFESFMKKDKILLIGFGGGLN